MVDGKTKILGVIGDPIEHTFSPAMHNAGLNALNLNYIYLPFHVKAQRLSAAIEGAKALGIQGLNVTIPHKQDIIDSLDEIDAVAEMIGAVNTVQFNCNGDEILTKGFNINKQLIKIPFKTLQLDKNFRTLLSGGNLIINLLICFGTMLNASQKYRICKQKNIIKFIFE